MKELAPLLALEWIRFNATCDPGATTCSCSCSCSCSSFLLGPFPSLLALRSRPPSETAARRVLQPTIALLPLLLSSFRLSLHPVSNPFLEKIFFFPILFFPVSFLSLFFYLSRILGSAPRLTLRRNIFRKPLGSLRLFYFQFSFNSWLFYPPRSNFFQHKLGDSLQGIRKKREKIQINFQCIRQGCLIVHEPAPIATARMRTEILKTGTTYQCA